MKDIDSVKALEKWLAQRGIDTSGWGTGGTKSVINLWNELQEGDVALQDTPPLRVVHVVQVIIRRQNSILIEAMQEFGDGSRRYRNQPPSEKVKTGEDYLDAALRCLREELGVDERDVVFNLSSYKQVQVQADSPSYPGLPTQYTFHLIEAAVKGLPEANFWHDNATYGEGDPVKRHYWVWQPAGDLPD
ncbi:MAG TPA: NUDIX domain-containing protein [Anaerolineae bacterium]